MVKMQSSIVALLLVCWAYTEAAHYPPCYAHCGQHVDFTECITTHLYHCQPDQFCGVFTKVSDPTGITALHTQCHPPTDLETCFTKQAANDPACDPVHHQQHLSCFWCCTDTDCLKNLAQGIEPAIPATTAPPAVG